VALKRIFAGRDSGKGVLRVSGGVFRKGSELIFEAGGRSILGPMSEDLVSAVL
jgi:hypothetical protein